MSCRRWVVTRYKHKTLFWLTFLIKSLCKCIKMNDILALVFLSVVCHPFCVWQQTPIGANGYRHVISIKQWRYFFFYFAARYLSHIITHWIAALNTGMLMCELSYFISILIAPAFCYKIHKNEEISNKKEIYRVKWEKLTNAQRWANEWNRYAFV